VASLRLVEPDKGNTALGDDTSGVAISSGVSMYGHNTSGEKMAVIAVTVQVEAPDFQEAPT
jgi:hypothetical protein